MKNLCTLFMVLMLLACMTAQAQIHLESAEFAKKGTYLFNPQLLNVGYSQIGFKGAGPDPQKTNLTQFGLTASGGYAIQDGLFILGQLGTQQIKFGDINFSFISIGGGARYYLPNNIFAGGGLLLNTGKLKGYEDMDNSTMMIECHLELGYSYFIIPSVSLEPSLGYGIKILGGGLDGYDGKLKYDRLGINLGVSVFF